MRLRALLVLACLLAGPATLARPANAEWMSPEAGRDPAIASLQKKVAENPASGCLLNELGLALTHKGYFKEAEAAYRASLAVADSAAVESNLGLLLLATGDRGGASSAYRRAIEIDPNYARAYYDLGVVHGGGKRPDFDRAVKYFKRAFELDPRLNDPDYNPHITTNPYRLVVQTAHYLETVGLAGAPMASTCGPDAGLPAARPGEAPPAPSAGQTPGGKPAAK